MTGLVLAAALAGELHPDLVYRLTSPCPYSQTVADAAMRWQVDPWLLASLLFVESRWRRDVRHTRSGALGVAQMTRSGAAAVGRLRSRRGAPGFAYADATDPEKAIPAAAEMLSFLADHCGGLVAAVGAYGSGRCGGARGFSLRVVQLASRWRTRAGLPPLVVKTGPRKRPET